MQGGWKDKGEVDNLVWLPRAAPQIIILLGCKGVQNHIKTLWVSIALVDILLKPELSKQFFLSLLYSTFIILGFKGSGGHTVEARAFRRLFFKNSFPIPLSYWVSKDLVDILSYWVLNKIATIALYRGFCLMHTLIFRVQN